MQDDLDFWNRKALSDLEDARLSPPSGQELFPVNVIVTGEPLSEDSQLWYVCGEGPFFDEEGAEAGYEESSCLGCKDEVSDDWIERGLDLFSTNENAWIEVEWAEPGE